MRTDVSPRFRDYIGQAVQVVSTVEWTNDGAEWHAADLVSGSVTRSLSSSTHWTTSLTLLGCSADWSSINPLNTRIRIRHGFQYAPGDIELLNFGVYRVTSAEQDDNGGPVSVEGESYESFVIQANLERPTTYRAASANEMLRQVVGPVLGFDPSLITWDPRILDKRDTPIPPVLLESARWDLVDGDSSSGEGSVSVAAAVGARVIADADGGLLVVPVPTLQDPPVGSLEAGGLLVSSSRALTADGVANVVIGTGATLDGVMVGPVIVKDTDRESPTYWARPITAGGFGEAIYELSSSVITDVNALTAACRAALAQRIGLRQQVTFEGVHNPLTEPGDVWLVAGTRVILDSVTYDLTGADLQADTRAQAALSDGTVWDVPDDSDAGEGDTNG